MSISMRLPAALIDDKSWQAVAHAVSQLENQWKTGGTAEIAQYLQGIEDECRLRVLVELIKVDQECRWSRGQEKHVEGYLGEWPELRSNADSLLELVEAECLTRAVLSSELETAEGLYQRFPEVSSMVDLQEIAGEAAAENPKLHQTIIVEPVTRTLTEQADQDSPEPPRPHVGTAPVLERYDLVEELGKGGMGTVYRATDKHLNREVALKIPRADLIAIPEARSRFLREAQAAASVEHSNVCTVYDAGESDGTYFITMKLVRGDSLSNLVKDGPLEPGRATEIVRKLTLALGAIHEAGIVHRDIKPSNVMLDGGEPLLMDFGLARPQVSSDDTLTMSGAIVGTAHYMPPEQVNGQKATPLSDVYSLGAVLYQLLTGRTPFSGRLSDIMYHVSNTEPERPASIQSGIPPALEAVCLKAMSKRPEDRFQSAGEFTEALSAYENGTPAVQLAVRQAADPTRTGEPRKSKKAMVLGSLTFLLGVIILFKTGNGSLELKVPDGAAVSIDGRDVKIIDSAGTYSLSIGDHVLDITHNGLRTRDEVSIQWRGEVVSRTFAARRNVATAENGSVATAYSSDESRPPDKAIDGATGGEFAWEGLHGEPKWWMVEFPGVYYIDRIDVVWGSHQHLYNIETSVDGEAWAPAVANRVSDNAEGITGESTHEIIPVWARFLRINFERTSAPRTHRYQATLQEVIVLEALKPPTEGPVGVPAATAPLVNAGFEKDLFGWRVYCPGETVSNIKTPGIIVWSPEHGGSAKVRVSGKSSSIVLHQRLGTYLPKGSKVTLEVVDEPDPEDSSSWRACLGGLDEYSDRVEDTKRRDFVVLTATRDFYPGSSLTLTFSTWPGEASFWVKNVSVQLPE